MESGCRFDRDSRGQTGERWIVALAEGQHAVVSRSQLLAGGLSSDTIDRRVAAGRLHVMHRGVYAVGHRLVSLRGRWMAAVLACGPHAALTHRDAAALTGLRAPSGRLIEVTAPDARARPGIRAYRHSLLPDEVTAVEAIPTTTWARTLIDLAAVLAPHQLARALEQAEILRIFDLDVLQALLERHRRRPGTAGLERALAQHRATSGHTRNDLEALLVSLCRQAQLPLPSALNAWMTLPDGRQIQPDAVWHDHMLIVEVDGFETHGTRTAFEADRIRDAELQILGWRVLRTTWRQLEREPQGFVDRLGRLLGGVG